MRRWRRLGGKESSCGCCILWPSRHGDFVLLAPVRRHDVDAMGNSFCSLSRCYFARIGSDLVPYFPVVHPISFLTCWPSRTLPTTPR